MFGIADFRNSGLKNSGPESNFAPPTTRSVYRLLPRGMVYRRGLAMIIPLVCLSVCPSMQIFYIVWKIIKISFLRKRMVGGGRPLLRKILGQTAPVGAKSPIIHSFFISGTWPIESRTDRYIQKIDYTHTHIKTKT